MGGFIDFLKDGLVEALWPTRCVGCDCPNTLLCNECCACLPAIDQRYACLHCGAPFGSLVCTECTTSSKDDYEVHPPQIDFSVMRSLCSYGIHEWPLDRLIRAYKDWDERRLDQILGELIVQALHDARACHPRLWEGIEAITFVPASAKAYRTRGFDHLQPIAAHVACLMNLPMCDVLMRDVSQDQRHLGREGRLRNVRNSMHVVEAVNGANLLIIDDVLTTGATLTEAARALIEAGAQCVWGATAARAW